MGHPDSKDPSNLCAQCSADQYKLTHMLNKFVFSHTRIGIPQLKLGHLAKKLTKGWGILTEKIPLTCMLNTQQISTSTHFSHTRVGTPRLKMGHLAEKLTNPNSL